MSNGLGFNGYDEEGNSKWDLISNADVRKIEVNSPLVITVKKKEEKASHFHGEVPEISCQSLQFSSVGFSLGQV